MLCADPNHVLEVKISPDILVIGITQANRPMGSNMDAHDPQVCRSAARPCAHLNPTQKNAPTPKGVEAKLSLFTQT